MPTTAPEPQERPQACACDVCAAVSDHTAVQLAILRDLNALGMRMARALCEEVEAREETPQRRAGDPALMISRIARAVRLSLALETRLLEGAQAQRGRDVAEAGRRREAERSTRIERRQGVRLLVEDAIDIEGPQDQERQEALLAEADERLADPAEDARFQDCSDAEWAAAICADLGVPFNPDAWFDLACGLDSAALRPDSEPELGPEPGSGPKAEPPAGSFPEARPPDPPHAAARPPDRPDHPF